MSHEFKSETSMNETMKKYGWSNFIEDDEEEPYAEINEETNTFVRQFMAGETLSEMSRTEIITAIGRKALDGVKYLVTNEHAKREAKKLHENEEEAKRSKTSILLVIAGCIFGLYFLFVVAILFLSNSSEQERAEGTSIVEVAKRELEDSSNNIGGLKYKNWYGINGDWCAMFVSYCANECGYIDAGIMPKQAAVRYMAAWYQDNSQWMSKESGYEPKPGDIIFFQNGMSHVGIVIAYDTENKMIYTIEGNTGKSNTNPYHAGSQVKEKHYPLTYKKISGYGLPNYIEVERTEESEKNPIKKPIKIPIKVNGENEHVPIRK